MDPKTHYNASPFVNHLGIKVTKIENGEAEGKLELGEDHSSQPDRIIAHGGVTFSFADTIGGAAAFSLHNRPTPTIDMRIDYLYPAMSNLLAESRVIRYGGSTAVCEVDVMDVEENHVARAMGAYKTGGDQEGSKWMQ